ncbi:hypothetical protein GCM10029964_009870 [Kibdelosporangium lantanae]
MGTREPLTAVTELTGVPATDVHRLSGDVYEVDLQDGDLVVAKRHQHPTAVLAEVRGLEWIGSDVPVPTIRAYDDEWLVIEQIEPGQPRDAEGLGRALAAMHKAGAPAFGSPPPDGPADAWIGMAPMRNVPYDTWAEFYATQRILPYVQGLDTNLFDQVIATLDDVPIEPPARLHGDLWSGNVHWATDGRAWLIDPAAHGGHRETDLAMLQLFGCPLLDRVLGAYQEVHPLADGWRQRIPLHQLFPSWSTRCCSAAATPPRRCPRPGPGCEPERAVVTVGGVRNLFRPGWLSLTLVVILFAIACFWLLSPGSSAETPNGKPPTTESPKPRPQPRCHGNRECPNGAWPHSPARSWPMTRSSPGCGLCRASRRTR